MSAESFLDTNILVYAATGRGVAESKRGRAVELIETEEFGVSAQVLQEFFVTVATKIPTPLTIDQALEWIEHLETFPYVAIDAQLVKLAVEASERHRLSYWDAAIVTAAESLGHRRFTVRTSTPANATVRFAPATRSGSRPVRSRRRGSVDKKVSLLQ